MIWPPRSKMCRKAARKQYLSGRALFSAPPRFKAHAALRQRTFIIAISILYGIERAYRASTVLATVRAGRDHLSRSAVRGYHAATGPARPLHGQEQRRADAGDSGRRRRRQD